MDIKTIIAIGSILSVILSAIGGNNIKTSWFELGPLDKKTRVFLGAIGIILFIFLIYFFLSPELNNKVENAHSTQTAFSLTQMSFDNSQNNFYSTQTALASNITPQITNPTATSMTSSFISNQTPTPSATITPSPTATINGATLQANFNPMEYCINYYSVLVKTGPSDYYEKKAILTNSNNLSNPVCLLFDLRLPDNSWIRIAPNQKDHTYAEYEMGWIKSNQVSSINFDKLQIYIPESVKAGEYCTTSQNGLRIRSCPNNSCETRYILPLETCLIYDARTNDNKWARISLNQKENIYQEFAGNWVNSYFISPAEFSQTYNPFIQFYLDLLPVVTPIPTPDG